MFININDIRAVRRKPCIDITKEVIIGPSPWEKYLAEKERQKMLPMIIDKKDKK